MLLSENPHPVLGLKPQHLSPGLGSARPLAEIASQAPPLSWGLARVGWSFRGAEGAEKRPRPQSDLVGPDPNSPASPKASHPFP